MNFQERKLMHSLRERIEFDAFFQQAFAEHFNIPVPFDWRLFKAQAWVESSLNPSAISPRGAMGLMQIMPATWEEIAQRIGVADPWNPEENIRAGVSYMRRLWNLWRRFKDDPDQRLSFALASYSAGPGNIRKMLALASKKQERSQNESAFGWQSVSRRLPDVTGAIPAQETCNYVVRVLLIYEAIKSDAAIPGAEPPATPTA